MFTDITVQGEQCSKCIKEFEIIFFGHFRTNDLCWPFPCMTLFVLAFSVYEIICFGPFCVWMMYLSPFHCELFIFSPFYVWIICLWPCLYMNYLFWSLACMNCLFWPFPSMNCFCFGPFVYVFLALLDYVSRAHGMGSLSVVCHPYVSQLSQNLVSRFLSNFWIGSGLKNASCLVGF